jgi:hypothetical protein
MGEGQTIWLGEEGERGAGEGNYSRLFLVLVACARK